jgi:hypothetical protein
LLIGKLCFTNKQQNLSLHAVAGFLETGFHRYQWRLAQQSLSLPTISAYGEKPVPTHGSMSFRFAALLKNEAFNYQ